MAGGALTAKTAVLFFTSVATAAAQSPTGSIDGVVRDPSGAYSPECELYRIQP